MIGGNNSKESRDRDINPKNPWDVSRGVMLSPVSRPQACHLGGLVFLILIWRGPDCWGRLDFSFWGDSTMQIYDDFWAIFHLHALKLLLDSCCWFITPAPVDMVKSPIVLFTKEFYIIRWLALGFLVPINVSIAALPSTSQVSNREEILRRKWRLCGTGQLEELPSSEYTHYGSPFWTFHGMFTGLLWMIDFFKVFMYR